MNEPYGVLPENQATQRLLKQSATVDVEQLQDLVDQAAMLPSCLTLFIDVFKTSKVWPIDVIVNCIDQLADKQCSRITLRSAYEDRLCDLLNHPSLKSNKLVSVIGFTLGGHFVELELNQAVSQP